ncbi:MAG TPA: lipid-A-disaccharide synthase, partial [Usitatibacter sp.]
EFYGIAGPKMIAEGARTLYPMEALAVRGYVEVLKHLREILRIRTGLTRTLLKEKPDLFIGVDAPDFNFGLERKLKAAGIPTVHYVRPSIWAWRYERVRSIAKSVDRMLVMFPFEEKIYQKEGIPVSFVGHPLADAMAQEPDRREARAQLRLGSAAVPVALLPGSRVSELELHTDLLVETARELLKKRPELHFFVPLATRETREYFERRIYELEARELPITILFGHARLALHASEAALVASGTAALEAALARCPMVITYRLNKLTHWLVKRKLLLPYVGLPNVLAGEFIVPELLQDDATPANLAQALGNWLDNKTARDLLRARFARLHAELAKGHDERIIQALAPYFANPSESHVPPSAYAPDCLITVRGR